jgi:hypothetical protein
VSSGDEESVSVVAQQGACPNLINALIGQLVYERYHDCVQKFSNGALMFSIDFLSHLFSGCVGGEWDLAEDLVIATERFISAAPASPDWSLEHFWPFWARKWQKLEQFLEHFFQAEFLEANFLYKSMARDGAAR